MDNFNCELENNVFSGEDYEQVSAILRNEFRDYADSTQKIWKNLLEEEVNVADDPQEREESLKRVLEETFQPIPRYALSVERYVQDNLGYLGGNTSNIDEDQKNVLNGWMLWDFMHKMEDIRERQSDMGEEVEDSWLPDPTLEVSEIANLYSTLLKRWTFMRNNRR